MQIKFRAWDKERKEMRQVQLMDWSDWWVSTGHTWERDNALEYGERNSFRNERTDRHILMQFTGLRNVAGTEIYEGDILRDNEADEHFGGNNLLFVVEWLENETAFAFHRNGTNIYENSTDMMNDDGLITLEVIGNVHQHPHLLGGDAND